jgi:hypothetical protein
VYTERTLLLSHSLTLLLSLSKKIFTKQSKIKKMNKLSSLLFFILLAQLGQAQNANPFSINELRLKNEIKLSLFNPLNGEMPIFYERRLTPKISAEIGLGVTKWLPVTINSMLCSATFQGYAIAKSRLGVYAAPALKYYPFGQNKGLFLSAGMLYKRFNYNVLDNEKQVKKATRTDLDKARLAIGYTEHWGRFVGEFQVGAAQRSTAKTPHFKSNEGYFSESERTATAVKGFVTCKIGYRF